MNNYTAPGDNIRDRERDSHVTRCHTSPMCHAHHHSKQITDDGKTGGYFGNKGVKTRGQFCVILSRIKSLFWSEAGLDQSYYVCHGRLVPAPGTRTEAMRGKAQMRILL